MRLSTLLRGTLLCSCIITSSLSAVNINQLRNELQNITTEQELYAYLAYTLHNARQTRGIARGKLQTIRKLFYQRAHELGLQNTDAVYDDASRHLSLSQRGVPTHVQNTQEFVGLLLRDRIHHEHDPVSVYNNIRWALSITPDAHDPQTVNPLLDQMHQQADIQNDELVESLRNGIAYHLGNRVDPCNLPQNAVDVVTIGHFADVDHETSHEQAYQRLREAAHSVSCIEHNTQEYLEHRMLETLEQAGLDTDAVRETCNEVQQFLEEEEVTDLPDTYHALNGELPQDGFTQRQTDNDTEDDQHNNEIDIYCDDHISTDQEQSLVDMYQRYLYGHSVTSLQQVCRALYWFVYDNALSGERIVDFLQAMRNEAIGENEAYLYCCIINMIDQGWDVDRIQHWAGYIARRLDNGERLPVEGNIDPFNLRQLPSNEQSQRNEQEQEQQLDEQLTQIPAQENDYSGQSRTSNSNEYSSSSSSSSDEDSSSSSSSSSLDGEDDQLGLASLFSQQPNENYGDNQVSAAQAAQENDGHEQQENDGGANLTNFNDASSDGSDDEGEGDQGGSTPSSYLQGENQQQLLQQEQQPHEEQLTQTSAQENDYSDQSQTIYGQGNSGENPQQLNGQGANLTNFDGNSSDESDDEREGDQGGSTPSSYLQGENQQQLLQQEQQPHNEQSTQVSGQGNSGENPQQLNGQGANLFNFEGHSSDESDDEREGDQSGSTPSSYPQGQNQQQSFQPQQQLQNEQLTQQANSSEQMNDGGGVDLNHFNDASSGGSDDEQSIDNSENGANLDLFDATSDSSSDNGQHSLPEIPEVTDEVRRADDQSRRIEECGAFKQLQRVIGNHLNFAGWTDPEIQNCITTYQQRLQDWKDVLEWYRNNVGDLYGLFGPFIHELEQHINNHQTG